jgi:DNA processing protein
VDGDLNNVLQRPTIAIVGSRKVSAYGRDVTKRLARELAEQGMVIVSGLAFGVDSIAHQAVLDAGGQTIAVLPSPLESIYPASHRQLAKRIVEQGGALVTEYPAGTESFKGNFVARNRIIAGLADATLVTEAALKSGSLHTARFALNAGRDVLSVPGNITSPTSEGTNNLIKHGATPVTSVDDVLFSLGIDRSATKAIPKGSNEAEQTILNLLHMGVVDGAQLQAKSGLSIEQFNQHLTMLEITGKIRSLGANQWSP